MTIKVIKNWCGKKIARSRNKKVEEKIVKETVEERKKTEQQSVDIKNNIDSDNILHCTLK